VIFEPFRGSAAEHLRDLAVYVLPSSWEAFPIGVLEALACGVPQVATDVGGTREAITPETGILVAPRDPGALAHAVLERTLELLRERTGSARIVPERLEAALGTLHEALAERARGPEPARRRALLRGLEADLERYLRTEAECGAGYEPAELEWSFGGPDDAHGPLSLGAGGGLVTGRVDRVDIGPGGAAIVRDYKGRSVVGGVKWADELQLQVALYLLAVRDLLGLEPVAGLYQPLAGRTLGARGLVRDDVPGAYTRTDVVGADAFAVALEDARELAAGTAAELHAGRLRPCPERCSSRGCRYPGICRAGEPLPRPEASSPLRSPEATA
jgi:hypothetical protein